MSIRNELLKAVLRATRKPIYASERSLRSHVLRLRSGGEDRPPSSVQRIALLGNCRHGAGKRTTGFPNRRCWAGTGMDARSSRAPLPDFSLPASTGQTLSQDSFRGKVPVAIVFLAGLDENRDLVEAMNA